VLSLDAASSSGPELRARSGPCQASAASAQSLQQQPFGLPRTDGHSLHGWDAAGGRREMVSAGLARSGAPCERPPAAACVPRTHARCVLMRTCAQARSSTFLRWLQSRPPTEARGAVPPPPTLPTRPAYGARAPAAAPSPAVLSAVASSPTAAQRPPPRASSRSPPRLARRADVAAPRPPPRASSRSKDRSDAGVG